MFESSKLEDSDLNDKGFPRLKRKLHEHRWLIAFFVLGFFVFVLPGWDGGSNLGMAAWVCSTSVAITVEVFWVSRRKLWFQITVSLLVVAHVIVFCLIHWTKQHYFGAVYRGVGMVDICFDYFVMWLARGIAGDGWQDRSASHGRIETEQGLNLLARD